MNGAVLPRHDAALIEERISQDRLGTDRIHRETESVAQAAGERLPLSAPDPDMSWDLAAVFAQTYDDARYDDSVIYSAPLALPLAPEDLAWVEDQARGFAGRSGQER